MKQFCDRYQSFSGRWLLMLLFAFLLPAVIYAQEMSTPPPLRDLKVMDEYSDGKGNIVRVIQFSQGLMRVRQTIIMPRKPGIGTRVPILADTMKKDLVTLLVDKSDYCLQVWYRQRLIRVYKAVFGPRPLDNKIMEGDRCTPEGSFRIARLNAASRYDRYLGLNYPNDTSLARFNQMKSSGALPASARIGGDVGIHGIWPGGDDMIELGVGWTDGCVALKNKDIEELYTFVGVGTKVRIQK